MGIYSMEPGYDQEHLPRDISEYEPVDANEIEIIVAMTEDYSKIMTSIYTQELLLEEEQIIHEFSISDIVLSIKKFLVKLWRAIAGMFNSFMRFIDKFILSDRAFINKYKDKLLHNKMDSDFAFTGHKFTINDQEINNAIHMLEYDPIRHGTQAGTPANTLTSSAPTDNNLQSYGGGNLLIEDMRAKIDQHMDELRAKVLNQFSTNPKKNTSKVSDKDFYTDIAACFRNGHELDDKDELKMADIDVNDIITEMTQFTKTKRTAQQAFREGKHVIDDAIKAAESKQKEIRDKPDDKFKADSKTGRDNKQVKRDATRELSYYMTWHYRSKNCLTTIEGNVIRALKERSKQYKAMIIKIVTYEPSKSEAAFFEEQANDYRFNIDFK